MNQWQDIHMDQNGAGPSGGKLRHQVELDHLGVCLGRKEMVGVMVDHQGVTALEMSPTNMPLLSVQSKHK